MKIRKKSDLHVVRDEDEIIINKLLTELKDEDMTEDELIKQQEEEKKETKKKVIRMTGIAAAVMIALGLLIYLPTYTSANVVTSYYTEKAGNNSYCQFSEGVLRYSRDGIAYLSKKNEEIWNHAYQIRNPFVEKCKETAVVADKGGNTIVVFDKNGIKGEMQTSLPIERAAVSEQGAQVKAS